MKSDLSRLRPRATASSETARPRFAPDIEAVVDLLATVRARQLRGEANADGAEVRYLSEHRRGSESCRPHRSVPEVG